MNPGGSLTNASFGPAAGDYPKLTISGSAVYEPSSVALPSFGTGALAVTSRFRKHRIP